MHAILIQPNPKLRPDKTTLDFQEFLRINYDVFFLMENLSHQFAFFLSRDRDHNCCILLGGFTTVHLNENQKNRLPKLPKIEKLNIKIFIFRT